MAEQTERTDFSDLVRARRAELGISVRELERRSVDTVSGEQAKFGWISKVERGVPTDAPSEERLKALQVGLQLPLRLLQEAAAAQYLGLVGEVWSRAEGARILVARIDEMSADDLEHLARIADTFDTSGQG